MKLHDLDIHKDVGIMEGNFNIIDNNSYAEGYVSPEYFDHCSEHEKVVKGASCSQLNGSDCDEEDSESHVCQGEISSGAEGIEVTDLFGDHGFTVSSLVSVDCNEDRGNTPSLDKSFEEDKDVAKEKVGGDMMVNISSHATDGSNVEENVNSKQKISINWLAMKMH